MNTFWKIMLILIATCAATTPVAADQPGLVRGFFNGAQEVTVPTGGVTSATGGEIQLTFAQSLSDATFRIEVTDGIGVTAAHLHCGRAGENGPIVVSLFDNPAGVDVNGTLAEGTVVNTDIDLNAGCERRSVINRAVNNIASLFMAIRAGFIYANVHTTAHPAGEVRAQLFVEDNVLGSGN